MMTCCRRGLYILVLGMGLGCEAESYSPADDTAPPSTPITVKRHKLAKNIFFEVDGHERRVIVHGVVCQREGLLEGLLTRKGTKEHEYIITADVDARDIHKALLAAGAEAGAPVTLEPRFTPAHGSAINVTIEYHDNDQRTTVSARRWIRDVQTGKDLDCGWVFAGSRLWVDPDRRDKAPRYLANNGNIICLASCPCCLESALMDLATKDRNKVAAHSTEANTERIPPLGTPVAVVLSPGR
jgi:hypothetical protein